MKYSQAFIKTNKSAKEFDSINATLLQKGGFIHQTMAGAYTFLPLGLRVLAKIEQIVREEMDKLGAELLMPALSPQEIWKKTGRLDSIDVMFEARGGNKLSREINDATYVLNSTHEDVISAMASGFTTSYKDLPFALYQIQTKFRNEPRPKSGLLRGREFRMKDLYSFHADEEDFKTFYDHAITVYKTVYDRLGLGSETVVAAASGKPFTDGFSHEFQTKCETGEDTIYYDEKTDTYFNAEIVSDEVKAAGITHTVSEVGNIFPLGTKYANAFDWTYTDQSGAQKPIFMGSYGIGTSRVMGVLVEKFHDDRGIIWPIPVAPFAVHLVGLNLDDPAVALRAEAVYKQLQVAAVDVLFDDRPAASPGAKLADADLIGCPWRVVISRKTGEQVEVKARASDDSEITSLTALLGQIGT